MPPLVPQSMIVHASGGDFLRAAHRIVEVGVAAVDDDVVWLEQPHDMVQRVVSHLARWHHHPDDTWRLLQFRDHLFDAERWNSASRRRLVHWLCAPIGCDNTVPATNEPHRHVAAHAAQAIDTQLHRILLLYR